ncbi:MAG TPA: hypothetical protein PKC30_02535 [Saprospiraceae bacterium]|nr:hypothetical protein [Saprospiraceae bacterium]
MGKAAFKECTDTGEGDGRPVYLYAFSGTITCIRYTFREGDDDGTLAKYNHIYLCAEKQEVLDLLQFAITRAKNLIPFCIVIIPFMTIELS